MKKIWMIASFGFILITLSIAFIAFGFLLDQDSEEEELVIGMVSVSASIYFEYDGNTYPAEEVVIDEALNIKKRGVYLINVTDPQAINYIENLRISVEIYSDVDTYLRIELVEYLALTIENFEGVRTEIAILAPATPFYTEANWYHNRTFSPYYYYMNKVKRVDENTPSEITMIASYFPGVNYSARPLGYSLQLALRIEAVQAIKGPEIRWNQPTPLWGGEW